MENEANWRKLFPKWTGPLNNETSHSTLGEKTAIDDEDTADDDDDDGRIVSSTPFDVLRRSSSFEDTSTSGYSVTDAITHHQSTVFPPPYMPPILVQSRRLPGRDTTPQTSRNPFVPPNACMDLQSRRTTLGPDGSADSRRPQPNPILERVGHVPTYSSSLDSESSFSEVESYAAGELPTSVNRIQTRSFPLGAEPQNGEGGPLHLDTSYTSETDSDCDSLTGREQVDPLKVIWRRLVDKKEEVLNTRAEIRRTRETLKRARADKDDADNALMSFFRPLLVSAVVQPLPMPSGPLVQSFRRMQQTRDKYQTCEGLLESLEDRLDRAERQLDILDRQMINELRAAPSHPLGPIDNGKPPPLPDPVGTIGADVIPLPGPLEAVGSFETSKLPELLLGIAAERAEDYHPLYNRFMSAIGYLQLAQEHHNDLLVRKQSIEGEQERLKLAEDQEREQWKLTEEQKITRLAKKHEQAQQSLLEEQKRQWSRLVEEQSRERSKLAEDNLQNNTPLRVRQLRDEDMEFLRDFEVDESVASEEVRRLQNEVEQFKTLCQEKGVIPRYAPLHEVYSYERDYDDDISIDFDPQNNDDTAEHLANLRFPLLLSNPSHLLRDFPVTAKTALKEATKMSESDPRKTQVFGASAKEFFIENLIRDARENDKSDFINRWLLHSLRTSPLEAELLYNCFFMESHLRILNFDRWQQDVLYYWPRDDAAKLRPEDFLGPLTPEDTQLRVGSSEIPSGTRPSQRLDPLNERTSASL
ncbi:hypothetical protein VP1G_07296 [Cytospora mali]|uniref:Uncharacterized protein n=1 Tax=Cytospora mali TaxID=578113 RepID=A0A194V855_CYTMA|nr:hypothetical protein VP1G_07296 [Valsa mali var. pyri (nom. inval.)]